MRKLSFLIAFAASAATGHAAWNTDMNPFTVLPLQQNRPENMTTIQSGSSTFVIYTLNQDGKTDLYLQMLDLAGNTVFDAPGKKINYGDGPAYPSGGVAATSVSDGGILVMYGDTRNDPDGYKQQPFLYKINAYGDVTSTPEGVALPESFGGLKYSLNSFGDKIIATYDVNAEGTYTAYTHLCTVGNDGTPGKSIVLPGGNAGIVASGNGYLCAYVLNNNISAQRYDSNLAATWEKEVLVREKTAMWGTLTVYPDGKGGMYLPYEYTDEQYNSHYPLARISSDGEATPELLTSISPKEGFNVNSNTILPFADGFCIFSSIREGWSGDHLLYASTYSATGEMSKSVELGASGFTFDFPAVISVGESGDMLLETIESTDYTSQSLSASLLDSELTEKWKKTIVPATSLSQVSMQHDTDSFTTYYVDAPTSDQVGVFGLRLDYSGNPLPEEKSDYDIDIVLARPGTLASKVTEQQMYTTKSMRLRGFINSDDVRVLRDMAGVRNVAEETEGILSVIDLSGATVVAGGEPYMTYYDTDIWEDVSLSTSDYVVPPYLVSKCSVTDVKMPVNSIEIGSHAFADCGILTSIVIPETVTSIADNAFAGSGITSLVIPENVTSLGSYAMWGCANLSNVKLPENLTMLPEGLLQQTSLESFTLGPNIVKIGGNVFKDCVNLKEIKGIEKVEQIDRYAFNNCYNLEKIDFGSGLKSIGLESFANCIMLGDVTIRASVEYIGNLAFNNCQTMTKIDVDPVNTEYKSIDGILYSADGSCAITSPAGHADDITIADGVSTIGASCFEVNLNLSKVTLPASVTKVENEAFKGCVSLATLYCNAIVPPEVGWRDVFLAVPVTTCDLIVPEGSEEAYKNAEGWKEFNKITTGVESITVDGQDSDTWFGIDGLHRKATDRGIMIRRTPDGKTHKVIRR